MLNFIRSQSYSEQREIGKGGTGKNKKILIDIIMPYNGMREI